MASMKKVLCEKNGRKRAKSNDDIEAQEPELWHVAHDLLESIGTEGTNVRQKVQDVTTKEILPKVEGVQTSIEVLTDNQALVQMGINEIKTALKSLTEKVDKIETKVLVCCSDVAEVKQQTQRRSDTETIAMTNTMSAIQGNVEGLKTTLDSIKESIATFRNAIEQKVDSDGQTMSRNFRTLAKWLNENVGN